MVSLSHLRGINFCYLTAPIPTDPDGSSFDLAMNRSLGRCSRISSGLHYDPAQ